MDYDFKEDDYQLSGTLSWSSLEIDNKFLTPIALISEINRISKALIKHFGIEYQFDFDLFELVE